MTTPAIPEFRNQICHSLIQAGITDEKAIIVKATALEQFVYGNETTPITPKVEKKVTKETTPTTTAPEPEQVKEPEPVEEKTFEPVEEAPALTLDEVKAALMDVAKTYGRPKLVKILQTFSAEKLTDLKPSQYAQAIALAKEALGEI